MRFFQQIVPYLYPLHILEVLIFVSFLLLFLTKRRRTILCVLALSFLVIVISSQTTLARWYIVRLEKDCPPIATREVFEKTYPGASEQIGYVVVLGAGGIYYPEHPMSSQIPFSGVIRLVEGIRWWREFPHSKLLLSGGPSLGGSTEAEMMKVLALQMGVPEESIELDTISKSTEEQIVLLSQKLKGQKFLIVTSARKMARAYQGFQKCGSDVIPIPTDYLNKIPNSEIWGISSVPWGETLGQSEIAIKEFLGFLWRDFFPHRSNAL
ncbi:MAG: ElyC/SanA/YdcF family protein [Verrucomicrobiota bacterium]